MEDAIPLIGHFRSPSIVENEISGLPTSLVANLTHLRSLILDGVSFDDDVLSPCRTMWRWLNYPTPEDQLSVCDLQCLR
jgi:hypothetical protein